MPSEQIINVMVTKADRFASMTTRHQNLRKSLCSLMLLHAAVSHCSVRVHISCFRGQKHIFFIYFTHVTSDFSLLSVAVHCSFVTGLTVMIRPKGWTVNMISSTTLASCCFYSDKALSDRHTFALNKLKSQTHPRWGTLPCEHAVMTCRRGNYDH